jgi:folate-dependent tRNA-U54 methylase TrmFO/GidA
MNFNFGLMPPLEDISPKKRPQGKSMKVYRNELRSERALNALKASGLLSDEGDHMKRISGSVER